MKPRRSTDGSAPGDDGLDRSTAERLLAAAAGLAVLVVGDVFLDEYLVGEAERLSREGPVPVLSFRRRFVRPGGGANPARNLAALGARVHQVSVVGPDAAADELRAALAADGIDLAGLVVDPARPTTVKTRVVAEGLAVPQQLARIDRQCREPLGPAAGAAVVAAIGRLAPRADAILVSHYRSGVVTPEVAAAARAGVRPGAWLTVDAQGDLDRFQGYHLVRVGRQDAAESLARPLDDEADYEAAALGLRNRLGARAVVLGRGPSGTSLADEAGYAVLRPVNVSEVFDVAGAGDTVIAVATLALAAGATVRQAVGLANLAAGVAVRRLGVVAPTAQEILAELAGRPPAGR
jgi:rfaE bifunctional protein kinase chain/domain